MSSSTGPVSDFDLTSFWRELQDFEEGTMSEVRRREVMDLLDSSHEARIAYFEYFHQSAIFEMEGARMSEAGRLPVLPVFDSRRRLFHRSLVVAAIITALLAIVATLIVVRRPDPRFLQASVAAETRWYVDGVLQKPGTGGFEVMEGSTIRVGSGVLELKLETGAILVMQGPAEAAFPKVTEPVLTEGWLWVDSGEGEDFAVQARELVIRDIGTRFGVRVPGKGPVEVHLIEGLLQVGDDDGVREIEPSGSGLVVGEQEGEDRIGLARDPFPDLPDLLAAKGNFRTTILSQTPSGYWKFDDEGSGPLKNEVTGEGELGHGTGVDFGGPGLGSQWRFKGLPEGNQAVAFQGDLMKSVVFGFGEKDGVSVREGAVSFWIQSGRGREVGQTLWLAGSGVDRLMEPRESVLHTSLTESGAVRFVIEGGNPELELVSGKSLRDGNWHQIVASWGVDKASLFVDGRLVDREKLSSKRAPAGIMSGRFVRFGKPAGDLRDRGMESFKGMLDEIAIWNRPLTTAEVRHQYESARDFRAE